jgi:hypothetical protein
MRSMPKVVVRPYGFADNGYIGLLSGVDEAELIFPEM